MILVSSLKIHLHLNIENSDSRRADVPHYAQGIVFNIQLTVCKLKHSKAKQDDIKEEHKELVTQFSATSPTSGRFSPEKANPLTIE